MTGEGKRIRHASETGKVSAAVTGLVERKLLQVCSLHTSSRLLSIWHVIIKFNSRHVVTCYHTCHGMPW